MSCPAPIATWGRVLCGLLVGFFTLAACTDLPRPDFAFLNGGDGEGIGGTGVTDGEGIGGTGIIGIVSDVDGLTINGWKVGLNVETTVTIDGKLASQADLRPGQMVMVEAFGQPGPLTAADISIRYDVVGPVTKIGSAPGELFVLDEKSFWRQMHQDPFVRFRLVTGWRWQACASTTVRCSVHGSSSGRGAGSSRSMAAII